MDKETRNTLRNTVTQCRRILEEAVGERLEGQYGIHASGKVEAEAHMGHLSPEDADYRAQLLVHVGHIQAGGYTPKEAVAQLVREVAFTHLNRLVAYKMMERRGLIREAVSRGVKSPGFLFYLADHPTDEQLWSGGQPETAYRHFLEWLGRTFAEEIRPLFAPHDPANPLFPPPRALDGVLARLNAPELADIWNEDETIGWVYQYFTPDELRREARAASSAPRNSYELAFLNQFYTPRYVVEFLSDNTLGRIWYEMRQGDTRLTEQCRYLVRRPHELFLAKGEEAPVDSDQVSVGSDPSEIQNPKSEIVPVPYRQKKDPRHLKILDPAGGSGHFLLYCFDLLVTIYEEAYDDTELGPRLQADYPTLADLHRTMPGLILRHNLHLIDIDRRATQIAALALWLRAQRAYQTWEIAAERRPPIRKANIVCAEPMPGDKKLLAEFVAGLNPPLLGQLVQTVFEKMKLAGEAGSLLKIEVELREAIAAAKKEWEAAPKAKQLTLFAAESQPVQLGFDLSGISDTEFWDKAEGLVLQALADYSAQAANGKGLARRLFAEDAAQGFSFIDLTQKQFDMVLMNPPFGEFTLSTRAFANQHYPASTKELYAAFVQRGADILADNGFLGAITSRTGFSIMTLEKWRRDCLLQTGLFVLAELGEGVLDGAVVETAAYVLGPNRKHRGDSYFFQASGDNREKDLIQKIIKFSRGVSDGVFEIAADTFTKIEKTPFAYWVTPGLLKAFSLFEPLENLAGTVKVGLQTGDDFRFIRAFWEINPNEIVTSGKPPYKWVPHAKGGANSPFQSDIHLLVNWYDDGHEIKAHPSGVTRSSDRYFSLGLTFPYRTSRFSPAILPKGCITGVTGMGIFPLQMNLFGLLVLLNSGVVNELISIWLERLDIDPLYQAGKIQPVPLPILPDQLQHHFESIALQQIAIRLWANNFDETTRYFAGSKAESIHDSLESIALNRSIQQKAKNNESIRLFREAENKIAELYLLSPQEASDILEKAERKFTRVLPSEEYSSLQIAIEVVSYLIGIIWGRWDVRRESAKNSLDHFNGCNPLPRCALAMLQNESDSPAIETPSDYPVKIDWDGILVDDLDHPDDIVRRAQQVLAVIWGERATAIEREACVILGVKELRDYFRKAGKGGFWDDHVKRYSKSRRKAPIYWLLQSSKGNYALWLYYHRLDKDLYYKALVNYVEPKLRLEENKLSQILAQRATFGTGGKEAKQLEKEIARQETFLSELRDFHDKLRAVAHLNLTPDLNDGVILNIAPLRELVPWKEAVKMWDELQAGKYEWSSVSQQLNGNSGRG